MAEGTDEAHPSDLAETFAEVARSLRADGSVEATMDRIVKLAVETIDGCDHAGISLVQGRKITTPAASDDVPVTVDAVQYEAEEGPCLDAIREHEVFTTGDLRREQRWPHFSARAVEESGVLSMLCFRLFVEENTLGALNLYSRAEAAFDADDWTVGSVFAAHAAVALSAAIKQRQLEEAVESRDIIGQAKGILMAREHVTADEAFDMLRRGSQRLNVKLRELAGRIAIGEPASSQSELHPR
ncbi:MAG: GAF and ANTAR domain-containing protein [Actinomycetota bacterium]|nr:GAF and ANTAR domain-containing protein [Actinomycetota bacterium]